MADESRSDDYRFLDKLTALLLGLPWLEVLDKAWKIARKNAVEGRNSQITRLGLKRISSY